MKDGLEARILHLEEQARFTLDVLEMASNLGDFQPSINQLHEPGRILEITQERILGLIHFLGTAFYLVNENSSDFELVMCGQEEFRKTFDLEMADLIENGIFALAIRENRPITVYSRDKTSRLVLHVLATSSRTRGMFVGLLDRKDKSISGILLSLLSIVMKSCANAIESFELYRMVREQEGPLRDLVDSLDQTVFLAGPGGELRFVGRGVERQLGYAAEEAQGLALQHMVMEGERERLARALAACLDAGEAVSLELDARRKDGSTFRAALYLSPPTPGREPEARGILAGLPA
jgi:PAS domain S-box-containing protein